MAEFNQIYQYSVIGALAQGLCTRGLVVAQIISKGDHGIGTLANLDGDLVIIEGEAYQFTSSGGVRSLDSSDTVPFLMSTYFKPVKSVEFSALTNKALLSEILSVYEFSKNIFFAFRIEGVIPQITYRVAGPQIRPRETLSEVVQRQRVDSLRDQRGCIFGFWSPEFMSSVTVAGLHMHFLSVDKRQGGHVLEFSAENVSVSAAPVNNYNLGLPQTEDFKTEDILELDQQVLRQAESMGT